MPGLFDDLDAKLHGELEVEAPEEHDTYSIEFGYPDSPDPSPAGQGERAAKHVHRISVARMIREMQAAAIRLMITAAKRKVADLEHRLGETERWEQERTLWDCLKLAEWYRTADQFQRLRVKKVPLAEGSIGSRKQTHPAKITIVNPAALERVLPECTKTVFDAKAAVALLDPGPNGTVLLRETGEVLPQDVAASTVGFEDEVLYLELDTKTKIRLNPGNELADEQPSEDANGTGTDSDSAAPAAGPVIPADPFGD